MLDTEQLRSEVYRLHHKRLDANDPIFMTITMNELLLANYLEQFKAMQEVQLKEIQAQSTAVIDECSQISTDLINRSMIAIHENYEAKEQAFTEKLEQVGNKLIENIQQEARNGVALVRQSSSMFQVAAFAAVGIVTFLLGILFKMYVLH